MMVWPGGVGTTAWKLPSEPATIWTTVVTLPGEPGWPVAMSTVAPGAVFPLTVAWVRVVIRPGSWLARTSSVTLGAAVEVAAGVAAAPGAVTLMVSGTAAGGALLTYRARVMAGWSSRCPVSRSSTSLMYWAWAQISGAAEPAALPLVNPIEAVRGSLPYEEAGTSGSSHACSGTRPRPDDICRRVAARLAAPETSPVCRSCSARSPSSSGHR